MKNAIITSRDWRVAEAAVRVLVDLEGDLVLPTLLEVMDEFPKLRDHDTGDVMKTAAVGIARRTVDHDATRAQRDRQLPPDLPPAAPLVKVETPDGLHHGDMIRVWHEILDNWASGWLEVVSVVGNYVVLTDARTGTDDVRYLSDTLPCWRWDG